ncbi:hypothetical protein [Thomasclavelia sp.]|uniref:type IV toxin-antitoxin system AbiEi family antitoxin domain-containing protein n=1 Tax=Thomasclavelia sp. TaxID=3025757 RepID=UPI0025FBC254|nr:hypothetical protein [Thomasclavelia sp.]
MSYSQCIELYKSDYMIKKKIKEKKLYKIEKGIYSTTKNYSFLEVITVKYPYAIFTLDSAFYYHSLTDVIPDKYHVITSKDAYKIKDAKIKQYFITKDFLDQGKEKKKIHNIEINIYTKERLLIELIRYKNKLPYDYYKEIIDSYRKIIHELDIELIEELAIASPKCQMVLNIIQMEVF